MHARSRGRWPAGRWGTVSALALHCGGDGVERVDAVAALDVQRHRPLAGLAELGAWPSARSGRWPAAGRAGRWRRPCRRRRSSGEDHRLRRRGPRSRGVSSKPGDAAPRAAVAVVAVGSWWSSAPTVVVDGRVVLERGGGAGRRTGPRPAAVVVVVPSRPTVVVVGRRPAAAVVVVLVDCVERGPRSSPGMDDEHRAEPQLGGVADQLEGPLLVLHARQLDDRPSRPGGRSRARPRRGRRRGCG